MIYRKRGDVLRWENGVTVRVGECGVARERGELFECHPEGGVGAGWAGLDGAALESLAASIRDLGGVTVERLLMIEGAAEHEYGEKKWSEHTRRIHLSLARGTMRALIDLGSFDTAPIVRIAGALARSSGEERAAPPRLRLAPNVAAALVPSLAGLALAGARVLQTAGGIDGRGEPIVETGGGWPNWYRPSYRVRPVRAPLDLRLECAVTGVDRELPVAVALLGPVEGVALRVLIDDGGRPFPATVRVTRIEGVAAEREWYPYGGGSFGAEMML